MPDPLDVQDDGPSEARGCCPVIELRRYTLLSGRRDVLIGMFEREFIEGQEALGIQVVGQFRHLDDPDAFVWIRGFADMPSRASALTAFYGGPVWKAHREAANATMIDSDNVRLLRPARPWSGFSVDGAAERAPMGSDDGRDGIVVANIRRFDSDAEDAVIESFERGYLPLFDDGDARLLSYFVTETSPNTFPALPVIEGEQVVVWFSRFRDVAVYESHRDALARSPRTLIDMHKWSRPVGEWRLAPTGRSLVG